ncbi:MAG: hypothetical protein IJJ33_12730 [Victivallales bacterium]|nr:hypothetical protein [Victivallales bacterium]
MNMQIENPLIPMAAITGRPTGQFIRWFMGEFRRVGITQFLLYPRSGCELEYLSEEWFQAVQHVLDAAQEHGYTSIWLYDEFNWPSGQCGGRVMAASPDYALHYLRASFDVSTQKANFSVEPLPKYPNLLNPDAVDYFIQTTHEEYARRFGKYFGTLIKGIFSDEPSMGYYWGQLERDSMTEVRLAWYPEFEEEYRQFTGRGLRDDLLAHFTGKQPWAYREASDLLAGKRFRAVFFDRVRRWCDAHRLLMTGHLMGENRGAALRYNGDPLLANAGFSLPGMDEINTNVTMHRTEWQTLGTVEYGARVRQNGALAELFALGPSTMGPAYYRQMIWLTSLFGVDHYLLAVSQFRSEGNIHKVNWYNPTSPAQTWFEHYDLLGDEAKKAACFARKERVAEIEIRYANHSPLQLDLLELLVRLQFSWHFLRMADESSPNSIAVLTALPNGTLMDERSATVFMDLEQLADWLQRCLPPSQRVFAHGWIQAEDVLLQKYCDGSCVILDLREPTAGPRQLYLRQADSSESIPFTLEAGGVQTFEVNSRPATQTVFPDRELQPAYWELPPSPWRLQGLDRQCHLCPEFDGENRLRLTVAPGLQPMRALLRNYGSPAFACLDGQPLKASQPCAGLPQGLNELYLRSQDVPLEPGEHLLELAEPIHEYPFLPGVFLQGEMAVTLTEAGRMTLAPLPTSITNGSLIGQGLRNYVGKAAIAREVEVPMDAACLRLETGANVASVTLGGQPLGVRCWAPYEWPVPAEQRGKTVTLAITLECPVGYLFGWERLRYQDWARSREICAPGIYHAWWTKQA